jgi:Ca2+-transporting ATPase
MELLGSDVENGLDPAEVAERQQRFGANVLTKKRGPSALLRFLMQFHSPLLYVLLAAAIATALLREWVESTVIFGVVIVNATIGYLQESKAVEAIEALSRRMASEAVVVRGGQPVRIPAAALVPGDVVLLKAGDKASADVRIVRGRDLRVDESALTGESVPVDKSARGVAKEAAIPDRTSMVYASTFVTHGQGRAVVVATGDRTEVGRIQRMLSCVTVLQTPSRGSSPSSPTCSSWRSSSSARPRSRLEWRAGSRSSTRSWRPSPSPSRRSRRDCPRR